MSAPRRRPAASRWPAAGGRQPRVLAAPLLGFGRPCHHVLRTHFTGSLVLARDAAGAPGLANASVQVDRARHYGENRLKPMTLEGVGACTTMDTVGLTIDGRRLWGCSRRSDCRLSTCANVVECAAAWPHSFLPTIAGLDSRCRKTPTCFG